MLTDNKYHVYARSKILYHTILFIAFFGAVKIFPFIEKQVNLYVTNSYLQMIMPWLVLYVLAIYLLPEVGFIMAKASLED